MLCKLADTQANKSNRTQLPSALLFNQLLACVNLLSLESGWGGSLFTSLSASFAVSNFQSVLLLISPLPSQVCSLLSVFFFCHFQSPLLIMTEGLLELQEINSFRD